MTSRLGLLGQGVLPAALSCYVKGEGRPTPAAVDARPDAILHPFAKLPKRVPGELPGVEFSGGKGVELNPRPLRAGAQVRSLAIRARTRPPLLSPPLPHPATFSPGFSFTGLLRRL